MNENVAYLHQVLYGRSTPTEMPADVAANPDMAQVCSDIVEIRHILQNFAKGNFDNEITLRGVFAGYLKTLQANMRHLSWQVQQVAQGDFSQTVDFMGDFSTAFNSMTKQLEHTIGELKREICVREQMEAIIRQNEQKLAYLAMHDSLTGLPNRYFLNEQMGQQMANAAHDNASLIVFMIDLDKLKMANNTYGHAAGDKLIMEFGHAILHCSRKEDTVARIGGDEFVLVTACTRGNEEAMAQQQMSRLFTHLAANKVELGEGIFVTMSMSAGVSFYPQHGADFDTLLTYADDALYVVKESGRGSYKVWEPECTQRAEEKRKNGI